VDAEVGKILAALDESGQRENTLIIFTSDHGEHLGDHGLTGKGPPGLDSCSRVPLLLSFAGRIAAGQQCEELVEAVDLAPTICDYAGVPISPYLQGRSLRPLLEERVTDWRDGAYCEWRRPRGLAWKTLRTHDWRLCLSNAGDELLFDLRHDPGELNNIAADPEFFDTLAQLRNCLLQRWFDIERVQPLPTGAY
jgi:arylsulfatase A-like enzyme